MTEQEAKWELANFLADISEMLGPKYKLTLICRHTDDNDAHILISDDSDELAISAIHKVQSDGHLVK